MTALTGTFAAVLAAATAVPVVAGDGTLNTITAGDVVVGILDPVSTQRLFNPWAEAQAPQSADTLTDWFPSPASNAIASTGLSATEVNDQYWASTFTGSSATENASNTRIGQIQLYLAPGSKNTVEASSVMTFKLSPNAVLLCAPGADTIGS